MLGFSYEHIGFFVYEFRLKTTPKVNTDCVKTYIYTHTLPCLCLNSTTMPRSTVYLSICAYMYVHSYVYLFRMQTCPRSCQAQCIVIMCCTSAQKNTSKAGSAATSAQVYLSTIVFTYVFLYIYDLPLNFSRKHCVNTYTHTHTSNSFHVDHKIV